MTQSDETGGASETSELQFDRAEPEAGGGPEPAADERRAVQVQCAACNKDLDSYYAVGEQAMCTECKDDVVTELQARTRPGRLARALLYGLPAAAVGSAIYYAILAITDYEIGLVAILIGFMVGAAVKAAAGMGGGRRYQVLAAVLTYGAIVTTYIPFVLAALAEDPAAEGTEAVPGETTAAAAESSDVEGNTAVSPTPNDAEVPVTGTDVVIAMVAIVAIAFAAPFLAGFDHIIGILIIGFGVAQAWRMNRRVEVEITGPHAVGAAPAGGTWAKAQPRPPAPPAALPWPRGCWPVPPVSG